MPRSRSPNRDKAYNLWIDSNKTKLLKDIAAELGVSETQIRKWKNQDKWDVSKSNVTKQSKSNVTNKKGGQPGNKNAVGNKGNKQASAPKGNLNPIKHGAYQNIYLDYLPDEEKAVYEQMEAAINLESEIKLLRLKITRLLRRDTTFFYDMFGNRHEKEISEENREAGILACMDQLERLIKTQAAVIGDTEKLQLEREKFDFKKYKDEIELQLKREKLELEKAKADTGEGDEFEDDGFIDALKGEVDDIWQK